MPDPDLPLPLFVIARSMAEVFAWAMRESVPYGSYLVALSEAGLLDAPAGSPYVALSPWGLNAAQAHQLRPATEDDVPHGWSFLR